MLDVDPLQQRFTIANGRGPPIEKDTTHARHLTATGTLAATMANKESFPDTAEVIFAAREHPEHGPVTLSTFPFAARGDIAELAGGAVAIKARRGHARRECTMTRCISLSIYLSLCWSQAARVVLQMTLLVHIRITWTISSVDEKFEGPLLGHLVHFRRRP